MADSPRPQCLDTEASSCQVAAAPPGSRLTCTFFRATVFLSRRQVALYTSLNCPRPIFFSIWKSASEQRKDSTFGSLWRGGTEGISNPPGWTGGPGALPEPQRDPDHQPHCQSLQPRTVLTTPTPPWPLPQPSPPSLRGPSLRLLAPASPAPRRLALWSTLESSVPRPELANPAEATDV